MRIIVGTNGRHQVVNGDEEHVWLSLCVQVQASDAAGEENG
jgi:hypothetical protein